MLPGSITVFMRKVNKYKGTEGLKITLDCKIGKWGRHFLETLCNVCNAQISMKIEPVRRVRGWSYNL